MAVLNFNAASVEPQKPMETVPAGWYTVMMVESSAEPTKDKTGSYLETVYEIMYPAEYKGRKLFDRFNLQNNNPTAVEIAYRQLSAVCHAVGVIQCADSNQLHGKPLMAKVKLVPAETGKDGRNYEAKNEISGYKAVEGNPAMNAGAGQTGGATPPWAAQQSAPVAQPAFGGAPANGPTPPWAAAAQPQTPALTAPAAPQWTAPAAPAQQAPAAPWAAQPQQPSAPATPPWAAQPAPASQGQAPTPPWARG